jgi:hypothetical protein
VLAEIEQRTEFPFPKSRGVLLVFLLINAGAGSLARLGFQVAPPSSYPLVAQLASGTCSRPRCS